MASAGELFYNTKTYNCMSSLHFYPAGMVFTYYQISGHGTIICLYNNLFVKITPAEFEKDFKKLTVGTPIRFVTDGTVLLPFVNGTYMVPDKGKKEAYDIISRHHSLLGLNHKKPTVAEIHSLLPTLSTIVCSANNAFGMQPEFTYVPFPHEEVVEKEVDPDAELKRRLDENLRNLFG